MSGQSIQCVVMFADVAGSTAMYENMGDIEARERISKALNTLIAICNRHKGRLVKTIGDEILVYFQDANLSLLAAESIQKAMENDRSPETVGISIRVGMHYGAAILEENDIFGDTVNTAARMESSGQAGMIHVSPSTAESLIADGRGKWVTKREDQILAKGTCHHHPGGTS